LTHPTNRDVQQPLADVPYEAHRHAFEQKRETVVLGQEIQIPIDSSHVVVAKIVEIDNVILLDAILHRFKPGELLKDGGVLDHLAHKVDAALPVLVDNPRRATYAVWKGLALQRYEPELPEVASDL